MTDGASLQLLAFAQAAAADIEARWLATAALNETSRPGGDLTDAQLANIHADQEALLLHLQGFAATLVIQGHGTTPRIRWQTHHSAEAAQAGDQDISPFLAVRLHQRALLVWLGDLGRMMMHALEDARSLGGDGQPALLVGYLWQVQPALDHLLQDVNRDITLLNSGQDRTDSRDAAVRLAHEQILNHATNLFRLGLDDWQRLQQEAPGPGPDIPTLSEALPLARPASRWARLLHWLRVSRGRLIVLFNQRGS